MSSFGTTRATAWVRISPQLSCGNPLSQLCFGIGSVYTPMLYVIHLLCKQLSWSPDGWHTFLFKAVSQIQRALDLLYRWYHPRPTGELPNATCWNMLGICSKFGTCPPRSRVPSESCGECWAKITLGRLLNHQLGISSFILLANYITQCFTIWKFWGTSLGDESWQKWDLANPDWMYYFTLHILLLSGCCFPLFFPLKYIAIIMTVTSKVYFPTCDRMVVIPHKNGWTSIRLLPTQPTAFRHNGDTNVYLDATLNVSC